MMESHTAARCSPALAWNTVLSHAYLTRHRRCAEGQRIGLPLRSLFQRTHRMLSVSVGVRDAARAVGASKGRKLKTLTPWKAAELNVTLSSEGPGVPETKRGC